MKLTALDVEVVGGIIAAAVLGLRAWLWQRRRTPLDLLSRLRRHRAERTTRKSAERLARHRRAVTGRASPLGEVIPLTSTSAGGQTTVSWSDSHQTQHYRDFGTYRRDMQAMRTPLESSFVTQPPTPLDRWTAEQCRTWLDQHPGPPGRLSTWRASARAKLRLAKQASGSKEEHSVD